MKIHGEVQLEADTLLRWEVERYNSDAELETDLDAICDYRCTFAVPGGVRHAMLKGTGINYPEELTFEIKHRYGDGSIILFSKMMATYIQIVRCSKIAGTKPGVLECEHPSTSVYNAGAKFCCLGCGATVRNEVGNVWTAVKSSAESKKLTIEKIDVGDGKVTTKAREMLNGFHWNARMDESHIDWINRMGRQIHDVLDAALPR